MKMIDLASVGRDGAELSSSPFKGVGRRGMGGSVVPQFHPNPPLEGEGMLAYHARRINGARSQRGFTLVEMIVVIVITGILGGMVAMFIRAPMQSYLDSARRAELSDIADTALRRMGRDVHTAVPNSLRVNCGSTPCVEFLPTKDGGRYRSSASGGAGGCGTAGDDLSFDASLAVDSCFEVIGTSINAAAGDSIVIGSTQSDGSLPYLALATSTSVRRVVSAPGSTGGVPFIRFTATANQLPTFAELDGHRFEVVDGTQNAVTYACTGTRLTLDANQDGQARLVRYSNYGFNATQALPTTANPPLLADKLSDCQFIYDVSNQQHSLLGIRLVLTQAGESVSLYHQIHVNNVP